MRKKQFPRQHPTKDHNFMLFLGLEKKKKNWVARYRCAFCTEVNEEKYKRKKKEE